MKKVIAAVAASLTPALLFASAVPVGAVPYVGIGTGINNTVYDSLFPAAQFGHGSSRGEFNLGGRTGNLNLFGGLLTAVSQHVYLGYELFANTTLGITQGFYVEDSGLKYKTRNTYGISLMPGVMIDQCFLYGRLGASMGNFSLTLNTSDGSASSSYSVFGGQVGVGVQKYFTQRLSMRFEYVYTDYNSFTFNNRTVQGLTVSPTSDQFNVGLVYTFA